MLILLAHLAVILKQRLCLNVHENRVSIKSLHNVKIRQMIRYLWNLFYCTKVLVFQAPYSWLKRHQLYGILQFIKIKSDKQTLRGWRYQVTKIMDITEIMIKENRYYLYATVNKKNQNKAKHRVQKNKSDQDFWSAVFTINV